MSTTLARSEGPADAELISAVRGGDVDAYGTLFERHVEAARRLARQLTSHGDADDLVSEAFTKVLGVLQRGGGPDVAFRAYLLTSVRHIHLDRVRAGSRLQPTDDMEAFDPGIPFEDPAIAGFESAAAAKAFASLPERWQLVLWHTEVEGHKPADIAPLLGLSANSVSALAYRAREGLRQAFLNQHAQELDEDLCRWTHQHLGAYVRGGVSKRDAAKVEHHLGDCRACMAIYLELTDVNSRLGALLAPLLLGAAGAGYLAAAGGVQSAGLLLFLDRGKDWVVGHAAGVGAAAAVVTTAAVVSAAAIVTNVATAPDRVVSDPPAQSSLAPTTVAPTPPPTPAPTPVLPARNVPSAGISASATAPASSVPAGTLPTLVPTPTTTGPTNTPSPSTTTPTTTPTTAPTETPGSPSSSPTPSSTPTSTPTETPTSTPTETPSSTPTETPSSTPTTHDAFLTMSAVPTGGRRQHRVTVALGGDLPAGERVTVTLTGSRVRLLNSESDTCTVATSQARATCVLTSGQSAQLRVAPDHRGGTVTATITSSTAGPDSDPSNDTVTLDLPQRG